MNHQSSNRSTDSSSSTSSDGKTEPPAVLNLTLYGSPAPRSVHRTSLGAVRARPRRKSTKPTTPPPSTPDVHLDLGSLAGSDSEPDSSASTNNLLVSNVSRQKDESHFNHQHSCLTSSKASSYHLSKRPSTRCQNQKNSRKINNKSKVSQMLFHNDEFEKNNKINSFTLKNVKANDAETSHCQSFSKNNKQNDKYVTENTSSSNSAHSSRGFTSDHMSHENFLKVIHTQFKEPAESSMSACTQQSSTVRSNTDSFLSDLSEKGDNCFSFSKGLNNLQEELAAQTSFVCLESKVRQVINTNKDQTSENTKENRGASAHSGLESCFEEVKQNNFCKNNFEMSADHLNIIQFASDEERSFDVLGEENKVVEEEHENVTTSSFETTIKEVYSESESNNILSHDLEPSGSNGQTDLHDCDISKQDLRVEKTSAHWFIPNDEYKGKNIRRCTFSKYYGSLSNASSEEQTNSPVGINENGNSYELSAGESYTNRSVISRHDHNVDIQEVKEEGKILSSQGSLGRVRKNSDTSWSSYHSSTYTTLSDSAWGCSSDTLESLYSEDPSQGNFSSNTVDELNSGTSGRDVSSCSRSPRNAKAHILENSIQEQTNRDFEQIGTAKGNKCSSGHLQGEERNTIQSAESIFIDNADSDKGSISNEICTVENTPSNDDADQTRESSSSGITGSMTLDSNNDAHHSSPESHLQEFSSDEKEAINIHKVSSVQSEEWAIEEERKEIISTATSEELCLLCSSSFKACRCPSVPNTTNDYNSSFSGHNSDNENIQDYTDSSHSFPRFARNVCSAPECNCDSGRTKLLLQKLDYFTTAPDVVLSAGEVMEAATYARQLVSVLEQALERALSSKMTSITEIDSLRGLRRSKSDPAFVPKTSFTNEDLTPFSINGSSFNTGKLPKYDEQQNYSSTKNAHQNFGSRKCFANDELLPSNDDKPTVNEGHTEEKMNICQEKCHCSGPKLLNVSAQELQQQRALLRPVDRKPQSFTIMKDMASILKNVISHRRDVILPPEEGACGISRSVSEWSIDD